MYREAGVEDLSRSQFDAAHRAFFALLRRKRMSPQFIERHGEDLFAQAGFEYSRQLAEAKEIANPVAWLVTCAWHRTVSLLESQDWKPKLVSTESVGELSADSAPSPEDAFLAEDRYQKIREAVEQLPENQRQLLALSYFADGSIRDAARRLRWTPSKGQRAHEAAQRRVHKLLGVETSDELEIELIAFLSLAGADNGQLGHLLRVLDGVGDGGTHGAAELGRHLVDVARRPFGGSADPASSTAVAGPVGHARELGRRFLTGGGADATTVVAGGGGDRAAELCKAVAVCLISGGAITGALLGGGHHEGHAAAEPRPPAAASRSHPPPLSPPPTPQTARIPAPNPAAEQRSTAAAGNAGGGAPTPAARRAQRRKSEDVSAEDEYGPTAKLAAEEESWRTTEAASVSSPSAAGTSAPVESSPAPAETSQEQSETQQVHDQFGGGRP